MADIRNFFARNSENSSNLRRTTPKKENVESKKTIKEVASTSKKYVSSVLSSDSDPEDPIPSKLRKNISKKSCHETKQKEKTAKALKNSPKNKKIISSEREAKEFTNIRRSPRKRGKNGTVLDVDVDIGEFSDSDNNKMKTVKLGRRSKQVIEDSDDDFERPPPKKTKEEPKKAKNEQQKRKEIEANGKKKNTVSNGKTPSKRTSNSPSKPAKRTKIVESPSKKAAPEKKLNPISVAEFFGGAKVKKVNAAPKIIELEDHGDDNFVEVLKHAEKDLLSPTSTVASTPINSNSTYGKTPTKVRETSLSAMPHSSTKRARTPKKQSEEKLPETIEEVSVTPLQSTSTKKSNFAADIGSVSTKKRESNTKDVTPKKVAEEKSKTDGEFSSIKQKKRTPVKRIVEKSVESEKKVGGSPQEERATFLPFVEKYKPKSIRSIIGQQGDKSCMNKLLNWLRNWNSWHVTKTKEKKKGFGANDDGSCFKAALLSGTPGVGKTTTAQLCCKELGMNFIELNASDARNKKTLEKSISESLSCHSMEEYLTDKTKSNAAGHVLIMDEVDGMSGNEDRAGVGELIVLIKKTQVPIVCICNDRQAQKIRSLANYCFDLRFHKPMVNQIRAPMMSIAFKEGLQMTGPSMDEIIEGANHDIRQILQHLNLLAASKGESMSVDAAKAAAQRAKKDTSSNIFETTRLLFSSNEMRLNLSIQDRAELFFSDYTLVPLFVHENYLNAERKDKKKMYENLALISEAADAIAQGDIIEKQIRTGGNWTLLNDQAVYSAVIPAERLKGYLQGMTQFPQWFGKNSKQGRLQRLLQQLQYHTSLKTSSNFTSLNLDYVPAFRAALTKPLVDGNVDEVLGILNGYDLTREDMDNILELAQWPNFKDPMTAVPSKTKAALTRAYNKQRRELPYATEASTTGKKSKGSKGGASVNVELELDEEGKLIEINVGDEEVDDDDEQEESASQVTPQIVEKPKKATSSNSSRGGSSSTSTSRGGRGRGRGAKK